MGDMMDYDKLLLSACMKDIRTFRKVNRVGFHKYFFDTEVSRYIYNTIDKLSRYDYYDLEAIKTCIIEDRSVEEGVKRSYLEQAEDLFRVDTSNINLAVDILKEKLYDKEMRALVNRAARQILNKESPEEVYEEMISLRDRVKSSEVNFESYKYYDGWGSRREERLETVEDESRSLKCVGNLSPFGKYFTRGIFKEEITAIGGPTYAGKSILLSNFINIAMHPENGLNVLYVFAENRAIQALSRIDAIVLDRDYDALFLTSNDPRGDKFFSTAREEGWGDMRAYKVVPGSFTADDIQLMIDECKDEGFFPDVLAIDSPDHQRSIKPLKDSWQVKGQVYWDIKALVTRENLIALTSLPMKPSSVKSSSVSAEDVAGSYDISRIVDNLILFNVNQDDAMLGRITLQIPKNREGKTDKKNIEFRVKNSLKVVPWEEFEKMGGDVEYSLINGSDIEHKFKKKKL